MVSATSSSDHRAPWNKGMIVGQKSPFRLKDIWAIRVRLQLEHRTRELALFDLGIDSKLRGCDLLKLRVSDVCRGSQVASRATVMQQKTQRPVQFEITGPTREAVAAWIARPILCLAIVYSRVGSTSLATLAPDNTPESLTAACRN